MAKKTTQIRRRRAAQNNGNFSKSLDINTALIKLRNKTESERASVIMDVLSSYNPEQDPNTGDIFVHTGQNNWRKIFVSTHYDTVADIANASYVNDDAYVAYEEHEHYGKCVYSIKRGGEVKGLLDNTVTVAAMLSLIDNVTPRYSTTFCFTSREEPPYDFQSAINLVKKVEDASRDKMGRRLPQELDHTDLVIVADVRPSIANIDMNHYLLGCHINGPVQNQRLMQDLLKKTEGLVSKLGFSNYVLISRDDCPDESVAYRKYYPVISLGPKIESNGGNYHGVSRTKISTLNKFRDLTSAILRARLLD